MLPIALNLSKIPVLLIGQGELLTRRKQFLQEAGATQVRVIEIPSPVGGGSGWGHPRSAGTHNAPLPTSPLWGEEMIVMIAGLPRAQAEPIAAAARAAGKLVNVEDINDLCDFYFTANVRRGDLIIAVSTSGASPTLARKIRDKIADMFGEEWAGYVSDMATRRQAWKKEGASFRQLIENAEHYLAEKGWLSSSPSPLGGGRGGGIVDEDVSNKAPLPTSPLRGEEKDVA